MNGYYMLQLLEEHNAKNLGRWLSSINRMERSYGDRPNNALRDGGRFGGQVQSGTDITGA